MELHEVPAVVGGRYRLREFVGAGGMGTVWRATDELLGRDVAIKRVRLDGLSPADAAVARERTMREARIAAALHHPNVVSIFDVVLEGSEPWLILEFVPSRTLGSVLEERGTLPPWEVAAIGAQVAAALAAAHAAGVVHRDVKPDNVLLAPPVPGPAGPQLNVKLTDFGIAHAATAPAITATEILTGTPAYFSPETARGEGTDARTDVYSLGATLYAAVEGHPPFGTDASNVLAVLARIARGQVPPPRRAGHLTDLLRDLTADDPATRPTASQAHYALLHAAGPRPSYAPTLLAAQQGPAQTLIAAQQGPPPTLITAQQGHAPTASRPPRRRGRLLAAVVGALAVVGATITAIVMAPDGQGDRAPAPTSAPSAIQPAGPPAVAIDDPLTADPCSLISTSALEAHGIVEIDRHNARFAECRADITRSGGKTVFFSVTFLSSTEAPAETGVPEEVVDGRKVYRYPAAADGGCEREVLLSDGSAVEISVTSGEDGPVGDLCDIADTGLDSVVDGLADGVIGSRARVDVTTTLGGTGACTLLTSADLAAVPDLSLPVSGFGDWTCSWTDGAPAPTTVFVHYYLGYPLGDIDGTPADFAGHPGRVLARETNCWVQFVQRNYTGEASPRIESVWVTVYGPGPGSALCPAATTLATAVAAKLPPPS